MGLALDEFALWLELKDVYWEKDGRKSIDAMILAGCAAGVLLVGFTSWATLADSVANEVFYAVGIFALVGIGVAVVNAAKQKLWWALGSLVFWPAGVVRRLPARQAAFALGAALLQRRAQAASARSLRGGRRRSGPPADAGRLERRPRAGLRSPAA